MADHSAHGMAQIGANSRALKISAWLTGIYVLIEMAIGIYTGSIAVISDAFHAFSAVGGVVLVLAPLSALVAKLGTANAGWLVLATGSAYMLGYELTHFAYHLPKEGIVGRNRLIQPA